MMYGHCCIISLVYYPTDKVDISGSVRLLLVVYILVRFQYYAMHV